MQQPCEPMDQASYDPGEKPAPITPMMAQYLEIKAVRYLLSHRMGDFYEMFFEDAESVPGARHRPHQTRQAPGR